MEIRQTNRGTYDIVDLVSGPFDTHAEAVTALAVLDEPRAFIRRRSLHTWGVYGVIASGFATLAAAQVGLGERVDDVLLALTPSLLWDFQGIVDSVVLDISENGSTGLVDTGDNVSFALFAPDTDGAFDGRVDSDGDLSAAGFGIDTTIIVVGTVLVEGDFFKVEVERTDSPVRAVFTLGYSDGQWNTVGHIHNAEDDGEWIVLTGTTFDSGAGFGDLVVFGIRLDGETLTVWMNGEEVASATATDTGTGSQPVGGKTLSVSCEVDSPAIARVAAYGFTALTDAQMRYVAAALLGAADIHEVSA